MNWVSLSASCSAASDGIARTSRAINKFVREVRESRSDLDAISADLHSLDGVLDLLGYDAAFFPRPLAEHTPGVLDSCRALLAELEGCITLLNRPDAPRTEKKSLWLARRDHLGILRWALGKYSLVLGLVADLVGISKSRAEQGLSNEPPRDASDNELGAVTARIAQVASSFRQDAQQPALTRLAQYLDILQAEAAAADHTESEPRHAHGPVDRGLDSALDVSYDAVDAPCEKHIAPPSTSLAKPSHEADEFDGELNEMPIFIPPVPPRSASRLRSAATSQCSTRRPSILSSAATMSTPRTSISSDIRGTPEPYGMAGSGNVSIRLEKTPSYGSSLFNQAHAWENPRSEIPSPHPTRSSFDTQSDRAPDSPRRSALSSAFRRLGLRKPSLTTIDDTDPTAVFGVPLTQSIQLAKGVASTRHGTGGSSARATREYPLSVLRCVYHIRDCGLDTPHLFGIEGDQARLARLKDVFNSPETSYGKELDWSLFTVHDAADLVLLFLSELPKPLVSESVGKRWIALSRQATIRGARLDQGLDFWEEALMGIQGPGRALFKLLLNLWGDIADTSAANEMTAERLAGRLVRPLMHAAAIRRHTDVMLGLAFLIRKRSEYSLEVRGVPRKSNAAF